MRRIVSVGLIVLALASCASGKEPVHGDAGNHILVRIRTAGGMIELEDLQVARTSEARARGLMGRTSLPQDGGMAFLFDEQTRAAFEMNRGAFERLGVEVGDTLEYRLLSE